MAESTEEALARLALEVEDALSPGGDRVLVVERIYLTILNEDPDLLKLIASMEINTILDALKRIAPDDSPLNTARAEEILNTVHRRLREVVEVVAAPPVAPVPSVQRKDTMNNLVEFCDGVVVDSKHVFGVIRVEDQAQDTCHILVDGSGPVHVKAPYIDTVQRLERARVDEQANELEQIQKTVMPLVEMAEKIIAKAPKRPKDPVVRVVPKHRKRAKQKS